MRKAGPIAKFSLEDAWQRKATEAAIAAARGVVKHDGPIPPLTPIGRLSDTKWGWLVAAILFGWISTRAQQATAENLDVERTIQASAVSPIPGTPAQSSRFCPTSLAPAPISTGRCRSRPGRGKR